MIKFEIILWRILAVTGLNFFNSRLGLTEKYFRKFFMIVYALSLSYVLAAELYFLRKQSFKESISYFLLTHYSGLLWYFSYTRKTAISYMVSQVYRFKKHYSTSNKTFYCILIAVIIIIPTLECVVWILEQIMIPFDRLDLKLWTFGFEISNKRWKRILFFIYNFVILLSVLFLHSF